MNTQTNNEPLAARLQRIANLEACHGIPGVSISANGTLATEEAADCVIEAIERGAAILSQIDSIPLSSR